jgi:hypothetical protein
MVRESKNQRKTLIVLKQSFASWIFILNFRFIKGNATWFSLCTVQVVTLMPMFLGVFQHPLLMALEGSQSLICQRVANAL